MARQSEGDNVSFRARADSDDHAAGRPPLEPHDIDPNAGELPPPLPDGVEAALHARLRGFDLIQLHLDGTPAVSDWRSDLLTSDAVIRERWTSASTSKVGGVTDGLVVLALTGPEGVAQYAPLAATKNTAAVLSRISKTILLFYRLPAGARSIEAALLPGVDVLSSDGYVVLPSGSATDACCWANRYRIAPAPEWLLIQLAALAASQTTEGNNDMGAGADAVERFRKGQLDGEEAAIDADQSATMAAEKLEENSDKETDEKDASEMPPAPKQSNIVTFLERSLKLGSYLLAEATPSDTGNTAEAIAFLLNLDPNGRHDLAAFDPNTGKPSGCATFLADEREKIRQWVEARQGELNLYLSVNRARDSALRNVRLNHEKRKDIDRIRAIVSDIDVPKKAGGDPSGRHFRGLRAKLLKEVAPKLAQLEFPPSIIVDSGGGLQLWWQLNPFVPATPENVELVRGIGRTINERISAEFPEFKVDTVTDPARIMRLPGTINFPDAKKKQQGRSPAPATVLLAHCSPNAYTLDQLKEWAPPSDKARSRSSGKKAASGNEALPKIDMDIVRSAVSYDDLPAELRSKFESAFTKLPSLRNLWNGHEVSWQKDISGSGYANALAWALKRDSRFTPTEFGQLLWIWKHGYELKKIDARRIGRDWRNANPPMETASGFEVVEIKPRDPLPERRTEALEVQDRPKLFYLTLAGCKAKISEPRPKHLIEKLIPAGAMIVTYGDSGEGKSFHVMDRWMHVAGGKPWCDRKVEQGAVVWVAAEMSEDLYDRIEAAKQHLRLSDETPFFAVPCPVDLLRPGGDTTALIELIKTIERDHSVKIVGVVIDTLSRAMAGGNENAPDDMGALVKHLDAIRYAFDCTVEAIHHTGKDTARGARGHSLLRAATDTEIEIGSGRIKVTKQRSMTKEGEWEFRLVPRRVGLRHDGSEASSCYVETREATGKGSSDWRLQLSPEQKEWLDALEEKAPKSKECFSAETAMVIWGLDKRTTATTRLGTLYGAGYLTKPKGEKGGMYALARGLDPSRRLGRQKSRRTGGSAVSTPSAIEENTHENNESEG